MKSIIRIAYYVSFLILSIPLASSCIREDGIDTGPDGDGSLVMLSVHLPAGYNATRALDKTDEDHIGSIEVLVFDAASEQYLYTAYGNQITAPAPDERRFTVRLLETDGAERVDLVLLANSRDWIHSSYGSGGIPVGESKSDVQQKLRVEVNGKWNTDNTSSDYASIPMWAEAANIRVDDQLVSNGIPGIQMMRMLARINVDIGADAQGVFELENVRLYNRNTKGLIIPHPDNLYSNGKAELPSIITGQTPAGQALLYQDIDALGTSCINEIYTFEALQGSTTDYLENTCLVIGGTYTDPETNAQTETYYRADFAKTKDYVTTYFHILRNHTYNVTVKKISGPGFPNPEDAFKSLPQNIEIAITDWNDIEIGDIWSDGQYYIGVSPLENEVWAAGAQEKKILIRTDYPEWEYSIVYDDPNETGWISFTSESAQPGQPVVIANGPKNIIYNVSEHLGTGQRGATIYIKAGRFDIPVRITQTAWYINRIYVLETAPIASGGDERTIVIEGWFDDTEVQVRDAVTDEILSSGMVERPLVSLKENSCKLQIDAYWSVDSRTLVFEYYNSELAQWRVIRTAEQAGYKYDIINDAVPAEITREGGNYSVAITGNSPRVYLRVVPTGTNNALYYLPVDPNNGITAYPVLQFPYNNLWEDRSLTVQYSDDTYPEWKDAFTVNQKGSWIEIKSISLAEGDMISGFGESIEITFTGDYPQVWFRAFSETTTISNIVQVDQGTVERTITLKVGVNTTGDVREAKLHYSNTSDFSGLSVTFVDTWQEKGNGFLRNGEMLALRDLGSEMHWMDAMGLFYSSNHGSSFHNKGFHWNGDPSNYGYGRPDYYATDTGCRVYYEEENAYDIGLWRVPTEAQMREIYNDGVTSGDPFENARYWTCGEGASATTTSAFSFNLGAGGSGYQGKTTRNRVRCIKYTP